MSTIKTGKDLTKEAPRSPYEKIAGFVILARTIDKCRADLWGNKGEYHFNCPLDNMLFSFKGLKGEDFKAFVASGATDEHIGEWVKSHGIPKTDAEIASWGDLVSTDNYASKPPEKKAWLEGENIRVGLDKDSSLFAFLDADDKASYGPDVCMI